LDINLKSKGIQPGDPMWSRILAQLASGQTTQEIINQVGKDVKNDWKGITAPLKQKPNWQHWWMPGY